MTLSDRIRAAALGPAPRGHYSRRTLGDWVGLGNEFDVAYRWLFTPDRNGMHSRHGFWHADVVNQRMALLFVAEAVDG